MVLNSFLCFKRRTIMFRKSFFKSYFDHNLDGNEKKTKFIQNRIKLVEKYVPELGKALFDYTDKAAKSRDCIDKVAVVLNDYTKAESVTSAFKLQLKDFANVLIDVGTKRDAQIHAMEVQVLEQLAEYEKLCKHIQNELKLYVVASEKEKSTARQLKKIKGNEYQDQQQLSLAEAEFLKARGESARSSKSLEEQIDIFEKKKINGIKSALLAWTLIELHFHSKALQLFTDAYRIAADIDVNIDVEEFRDKLRNTDESPRSELSQRSDSALQFISHPFRRKIKFTGSGIPHPSSVQSTPRSLNVSNRSQRD